MGRKVSREAAIAALVGNPSIKAAAIECGVSEKTLHAWLNDPEFALQLAEAQRGVTKRVMRSVVSRAEKAVCVLAKIMSDDEIPAQPRVSAARTILEYTFKAIETSEILARIEQLEKMQDENKHEEMNQ